MVRKAEKGEERGPSSPKVYLYVAPVPEPIARVAAVQAPGRSLDLSCAPDWTGLAELARNHRPM
jgi:hypothetical protein